MSSQAIAPRLDRNLLDRAPVIMSEDNDPRVIVFSKPGADVLCEVGGVFRIYGVDSVCVETEQFDDGRWGHEFMRA